MNLKKQDIRLGQEISNKEEAIRKAGEILVENGYVDVDYIPAMLEREEIVSTYMGISSLFHMGQMRLKNQ